MRKTRATIAVAMALLDDPSGKHWGYDLGKTASISSGVLYPILSRMLDEGWLTDGWEDPTTIRERRPPRRYYTITDLGITRMGGMIAEAQRDQRFADVKWRPAHGLG